MSSDSQLTGLDCPRCGYDLRGTTRPPCPECGCRFDPSLLRPGDSERRRVRVRILLAGGVICLVAFAFGCYRIAVDPGFSGDPFQIAFAAGLGPLFILFMDPRVVLILGGGAFTLIGVGLHRTKLWPLALLGFLVVGALWCFGVQAVLDFD